MENETDALLSHTGLESLNRPLTKKEFYDILFFSFMFSQGYAGEYQGQLLQLTANLLPHMVSPPDLDIAKDLSDDMRKKVLQRAVGHEVKEGTPTEEHNGLIIDQFIEAANQFEDVLTDARIGDDIRIAREIARTMVSLDHFYIVKEKSRPTSYFREFLMAGWNREPHLAYMLNFVKQHIGQNGDTSDIDNVPTNLFTRTDDGHRIESNQRKPIRDMLTEIDSVRSSLNLS